MQVSGQQRWRLISKRPQTLSCKEQCGACTGILVVFVADFLGFVSVWAGCLGSVEQQW